MWGKLESPGGRTNIVAVLDAEPGSEGIPFLLINRYPPTVVFLAILIMTTTVEVTGCGRVLNKIWSSEGNASGVW